MTKDYPMTLMNSVYRFERKDGTKVKSNYRFWRYLHELKKIETYKNEETGHRMVYGSEIDRLMKIGIIHGHTNERIFLVDSQS